MQHLIKKIEGFQKRRILVIGDLILDQYTIGDCRGISPEAPMPVIKVREERYGPGGAGNTAVNIKTLGSEPYLIGIASDNHWGRIIENELKKRGVDCSGIFFSPYTETVRKERIISMGQQAAPRIDRYDEIQERDEHYDFIIETFESRIASSDIVVVSDYAKGTLSLLLINNLLALCKKNNKRVIIDPRPKHTHSYKNASFITPNFEEASKMAGLDYCFNEENEEETLKRAKSLAEKLHKDLSSNVVLTLSKFGILYHDGADFRHFPTFKRQVRDVAGAGDTVVAALAVGLANGLEIYDAVSLANHAGGVAVEKQMIQPVSLDEVVEDIKLHNSLRYL